MKYVLLCLSLISCNKLYDLKNNEEGPGPRHYRISIIGDSMSSDDPGNICLTESSYSHSYGWHLKHMLDTTLYDFRNYAVRSVGIYQMRKQAQVIINEKDDSKINIVCILGGINNITFKGMTGRECYRKMSDLHIRLRSKGFKTIGIALTSRRQLSYFTEQQSRSFWSQIAATNSLFKKNKDSFCDFYLDLQSESGFAGYQAPTESPYFLDGCHFSDAGKRQIAVLLKNIVDKIR